MYTETNIDLYYIIVGHICNINKKLTKLMLIILKNSNETISYTHTNNNRSNLHVHKQTLLMAIILLYRMCQALFFVL